MFTEALTEKLMTYALNSDLECSYLRCAPLFVLQRRTITGFLQSFAIVVNTDAFRKQGAAMVRD